MSEEWKMRIAEAGARARAAMAAGATLGDVLGRFRNLGLIGSIMLLRETAPIPLWCLKNLVDNSGSYAHLTLADLEMLGNAPPHGVDFFIHSRRNEAIIERKPYLLLVRDHPRPRMWTSAIPLEAPPTHRGGSTYGPFELVCDDARRAAAVWPTELRILRDEPDQLLLHFLRAPLAA